MALAVIGIFCLAAGLQVRLQSITAPPLQGSTRAIASTPSSGLTDLPRSRPVSLRIPAIGVKTQLTTLGLNRDRSVQVPTNPLEAGWYRLGPAPGQIGSAVILGHVDSSQAPAVFFQLRAMVVGDLIEATLADGDVVAFRVTAVKMYLKTSFPSREVYGPHGLAALQLVTCGGTFDSQSGSYLSNVVVYSVFERVISGDSGR